MGGGSYFLLSFLPLALVQSVIRDVSVPQTIFIAGTMPLFSSPPLPPPPPFRYRLSLFKTKSTLSIISEEFQQWEQDSYFLLSLLPSAIGHALVHNFDIFHTFFDDLGMPLLPLLPLSPLPLFRSLISLRSNKYIYSIIPYNDIQ